MKHRTSIAEEVVLRELGLWDEGFRFKKCVRCLKNYVTMDWKYPLRDFAKCRFHRSGREFSNGQWQKGV